MRPGTDGLVLAALLCGCGWRHEVRAGRAAAADQDWVEAAAHYDAAAASRPDDRLLAQKLTEAREQAVAALTEQARATWAAGDPDQALALLDQAEGMLPRQLHVAMLREEIVAELAAGVRAILAGGDEGGLDAAIDAWTAFAQGFPTHPETARLGDELVAALGADARALVAAGRYAEARDRLQGFADRLPVEREQAAVRAAWAEALRTEAADAARKRRRATAWVAQALAAGLSGTDEDARARGIARQAFLDAQALVVGPRTLGEKAALGRLFAPVESAFAATPALRWRPGAPRAAVSGTLVLHPPRWEQGAKATVAIREVPGEARDHENPDWTEAGALLEAAAAAQARAAAREQEAVAGRAAEQRHLDDLRRGTAAVQEELAGVQAAFAAAEAEALAARAALDEALGARASVEQMDRQRADLGAAVTEAQAGLEQALAALERGEAGAAELVATRRRSLEDARAALDAAPRPANLVWELSRRVSDRAAALAARERAAEQARVARDARQAPIRDQLDAVARAEARVAQLDAAVQEALQAQAEAGRARQDAEARRAALPQTVFGPVIDRIEIPVQAHLRTCALEISVALVLPGGAKLERTLVARAETRDEERPAMPALELEADPLAFPDGDLQLQARAEADLSRQLVALAGEIQRGLGARQAAAVTGARDEEARLQALLAAWLSTPRSAEPGLIVTDGRQDPAAALRALLLERWKLGDLGWIER